MTYTWAGEGDILRGTVRRVGTGHKSETPWNARKQSRDRQEAIPRMENEQRSSWYYVLGNREPLAR
jgi:hypothetical protein